MELFPFRRLLMIIKSSFMLNDLVALDAGVDKTRKENLNKIASELSKIVLCYLKSRRKIHNKNICYWYSELTNLSLRLLEVYK
ncbi:hypothetical protein BpHYR1_046250 [Brachionus plicatilis]|uniref:Uncharacterized protein n=1 Tax=Brachionus plicatilis TaxID=10195 RepID=A0A3M7PJG5_BRAPC|nr:hypothetical protein BpHYR1_046250 [Brachionus plicatilis]